METNEVSLKQRTRISSVYFAVLVVQVFWAQALLDALASPAWQGGRRFLVAALSAAGWLAGLLCGRSRARLSGSAAADRPERLLDLAGSLGGLLLSLGLGLYLASLLPSGLLPGTARRVVLPLFLPLLFLLALALEKRRGSLRLRRTRQDLGLCLLLGVLGGVLGPNLVFLVGKIFLLLGLGGPEALFDLSLSCLLPTGASLAAGCWLGLALGRVFLHARALRDASTEELRALGLDSGRALGYVVKRPARGLHLVWSFLLAGSVLSWILYRNQWESCWIYAALALVPLVLGLGVWLAGKGMSVVPDS